MSAGRLCRFVQSIRCRVDSVGTDGCRRTYELRPRNQSKIW
ncbi:unnamed protein product [Musa acuminata subsp. malaccensis]|uniref:(wild Malaysian banana) hypothetical protein n=1 Tax=Musa acuminata subsp. malaccensis TaxID=214687 RepID=A0A804I434_MUSAM|nr:unnamed protein product [Musa acuminata subsp. malaccensis]